MNSEFFLLTGCPSFLSASHHQTLDPCCQGFGRRVTFNGEFSQPFCTQYMVYSLNSRYTGALQKEGGRFMAHPITCTK